MNTKLDSELVAEKDDLQKVEVKKSVDKLPTKGENKRKFQI